MTRLTGRELVEHITYWADAYAKEGGHALVVSLLRDYARAIEAELSKQEPVARPRLPRIDHFAREAFEKFASGVECELTSYRWFEAGWDARGDTVAAAPLPSAPDTVQVPRELEFSWLIEWKAHGNSPQWWGFKYAPGKHGDWCHDANDAIRFSRKVDAERMRLHVIASLGFKGNHSYEQSVTVTEHAWPSVGAAAPKSTP